MPGTLEDLRHGLADRRRAGESFDTAWPRAARVAFANQRDRKEWASVLEATRWAWRAAYYRTPASNPERALGEVGEGRDVLADAAGWGCEGCAAPIPTWKRPDARFCGKKCCQKATNAERRRLRRTGAPA